MKKAEYMFNVQNVSQRHQMPSVRGNFNNRDNKTKLDGFKKTKGYFMWSNLLYIVAALKNIDM